MSAMTSPRFNTPQAAARRTSLQRAVCEAKGPSLIDQIGDAMRLLCRIGVHHPRPGEVWNNGHYFGSCEDCGCDLVRNNASGWRTVPRGMRVVWRTRTDDDIDWNHWIPEQGDQESPHEA